MKIKKVISIYMMVVGIGIIALWTMLFVSDQIPELETEPIAIAFHITIEVLMGVVSIVSGVLLLKNFKYQKEAVIFANGMICYSVVNSSGYYGDLNQYGMIVMFFFLLVISLFVTYKVIKLEV